MGYCTLVEVERILAQALTSATTSTLTGRGALLRVGRVLDKNTVPTDIIEQYIQFAGQEIDATLSHQYKTPFCEMADFETSLQSDIAEYNSYIILDKKCPLTSGDNIIITDGVNEERFTIEDMVASGVFSTVEEIFTSFNAGTRVIRVKYPDPIPLVCARLASADIYDKYFMAQVSPSKSEYGSNLRKLARQHLNNILRGITVLHGYLRIGRRLFDPTIPAQYDTHKGTDAAKEIDDVG